MTPFRFYCDREGVRSDKDKNREDKKRKSSDETRCKAFINFKYMKQTCRYVVKEFIKEHNYDLVSPQKVNTVHVFRGLDEIPKFKFMSCMIWE